MADFAEEIRESTGVDLKGCFACLKCSNGCPVASHMDLPPAAMIRAILHNRRREALSSKTIWVCVSCRRCSARCPQSIDFARVVEALQALALAENVPPASPRIAAWHGMFLDSVRRRGRVHELSLAARYKLRALDLSDGEVWLARAVKGHLPLLVRGVRDKRAVEAAFRREVEPPEESS